MRHRIFTEAGDGVLAGRRVWRVQLAGAAEPINEGALSHAGALELLERRLASNEEWRRAIEEPAPAPVLRYPPPTNTSWWARFLR